MIEYSSSLGKEGLIKELLKGEEIKFTNPVHTFLLSRSLKEIRDELLKQSNGAFSVEYKLGFDFIILSCK